MCIHILRSPVGGLAGGEAAQSADAAAFAEAASEDFDYIYIYI